MPERLATLTIGSLPVPPYNGAYLVATMQVIGFCHIPFPCPWCLLPLADPGLELLEGYYGVSGYNLFRAGGRRKGLSTCGWQRGV